MKTINKVLLLMGLIFASHIAASTPIRPGVCTVNTSYQVSGGASFCSGAGSASVTLSDSQFGVTYYLRKNGGSAGVSSKSGTGGALTWTNLTAAGTYTVDGTQIFNVDDACTKQMTGSASISIISLPSVYSVTGGGSYCSGGSGVAIGLSDSQSGVTYQLKLNGSNVGSAISGTNNAISFGNKTSTGTYTVVATKSGCTRTMSGSKTISVISLPTIYSVTGGGSYCSGGSGVAIGLSDSQSGVTYQLKLNGNNVGSSVSGTNNAISFGNKTSSGTYTVVATKSGCPRNMNGSKTIGVYPLSVGGTITGGQSLCGSGSVSLSLSGKTGNVIRWEKSTNDGSTWTNINTTSTTLNQSNVTVSTDYRARVQSGSCNATYSNTAIVIVYPSSLGGTTSGGGTFCGSKSGTITLSGKRGTVQKWEKSTNNGSSWSNITNTSTSQAFNHSTAGTYMYRAQVKNGVCSTQLSSITSVTIHAATVAGGISSSVGNRCGTGSVNFQSTGTVVGTILKWRYRYKNGSGAYTGWTIFQETDNQTSVNLTLNQWASGQRTYQIRKDVDNGSCNTTYAYKTVTVDPITVAGTVSSSVSNRCGSGSVSFSIAGQIGTIQRWQSRYKNGAGGWSGWSTITETDNVTSVNPSLNQWSSGQRTYQVRATVKSGSCATQYPSKQVTIDAPSVGGTITGGTSLCSSGSISLTLGGKTGNVIRWEKSTNDGSTWTNINSTSTTLNQTNVTVSTDYRARVQSGSCGATYSNIAIVQVYQPSLGGTTSGGGTFCGSKSGTITLSGKRGTVQKWEKSTNNGSTWTAITNTSITQAFNHSTVGTYLYRAQVKNSVCSAATSTTTTVIIDPATVAGTVSSSVSNRCGTGNISFSLSSSHVGTIQRWQSRYKNGNGGWTGWSLITENDDVTSVNPSLSQWSGGQRTYQVRATVKSGVCNALYPYKQVTIDPATVSGTISSSVSNSCGSGNVSFSLAGQTGTIQRWQSRYKNGNGGWTGWSLITENDNEASVNPPLSQWSSGQRTYEVRATVKSGVCTVLYPSKQVTIDPSTVAGTVSSSVNNRCGTGNVSFSLSSSHVGTIQRWQSRYKNGNGGWTGWSLITENDDVTSVNPSLSQWSGGQRTYEVRATVKSGVCNALYPFKQVTIDPSTVSGSISSSVSNRCGSGNVNFSIAGHTGTIQRWQSRYKNGNGGWTGWSLITENDNVASVNPPLSQWSSGQRTYQVQATVKSGSCTAQYPSRQVTVDAPSVGGAITGAVSLCSSGSVSLTLGGKIGNVVRWEKSTNDGSTWTNINSTSTSLNQSNVTVSTDYRARVQSGSCSATYSNIATVLVYQPSLGGTTSGGGTFCGSKSGTITLSGKRGTIQNWEKSTDNGSTWTLISNTATTQGFNHSTPGTYIYRAQVKNGVCSTVASTTTSIIIDPSTVSGTISSSVSNRCGSGNVNFSIAGHTGTIQRWQSRYKNGNGGWTGWSLITENDNVTSVNPSLSQGSGQRTYEVRATVKSGVCTSLYPSKQVTIDPVTVEGTVSSSVSNRCGSGNVSFSIAGQTGTVQRWESRYKNGSGAWTSTWNLITENDDVTSINPSLAQWSGGQRTYEIRAVVKSGSCTIEYPSQQITIDVPSVGGTITGATALCNSGPVSLTLTGKKGNVIRWEKSTNDGSTWTNINNTTTSINLSNVTVSTDYRARVQSGSCAATYSNTVFVMVYPTSLGGTTTGGGAFCGNKQGTITLSGERGTVQNWEKSTDNGSTWSTISNTGTTQGFDHSTAGTYMYRAQVKNGVCEQTPSAPSTVVIDDISVGGVTAGGGTFCGSGSGTITLTGEHGTIQQWELSTNGGSSWNSVGSPNYNHTAPGTYLYRAQVKNGICSTMPSTNTSVTINAVSAGGTAAGGGVYCSVGNGTLILTGETGTIQTWELSNDGGSNWNPVASANYNHTAAGSYTYRAKVKNGTCSEVTSTTTTVTVDPSTVGGTITGGTTVCETGTATFTLTGHSGNILGWQSREEEAQAWTDIHASANLVNYTAMGVTFPTEYRAKIRSGVCAIDYSTSDWIQVNLNSVGGTTSGDVQHCQSGSGTINLTSETGTVQKWQMRVDSGAWNDIPNTTLTLDYNHVTVGTYEYRVQVANGVCAPAYSTISAVTIFDSSVGGQVLSSGNSNITVCLNDPITFTLTGHTGSVVKWQMSVDGGSWQDIAQVDYGFEGSASAINTTRYWAEVKNGACNSVFSQPITVVTSDDLTVFDATITHDSGPQTTLDLGVGTISVNNIGTVQWQQSTSGTNFIDIPGATSLTYDYSVTTSTYFQVRVTGSCNTISSDPLLIEVENIGSVTSTAQTAAYGEEVTVNLSGHTGDIVDWEVSFDGINFETLDPGYSSGNGDSSSFDNYNFTILETTTFRAIVDVPSFGIQITAPYTITLDESATPMTDYRQISSTTLLEKVYHENSIPASGHGALTQVSYIDGLGTTLKSVAVDATPAKQDVISFNKLERNSKVRTSFLSYVADDGVGANFNINDLVDEQANFYTNSTDDIADSNYPFAQVKLDDSPMSRVLEQGAPGADWQLNADPALNGDHTVKYTNRTNTAADSVRLWKTDGTSDGTSYPEGTLMVSEMTDENGHKSLTFNDKSGKTILKKSEGENSTWITTGYVHDLVGRIKYTISPEGMNQIPATGAYSPSVTEIDEWMYSYVYDERGRLVEKKLPGKAVQYYIYDKLDRLLFSQDGILRTTSRWTFVKYDQRHRPVMTGLYTDTLNITRTTMQAVVDSLDYDGADAYYETKNNIDSTHNYTNKVFPTVDIEVLSITYYDSYDTDENGTADHTYTASGLIPEPLPLTNVHGLVTATKIKVLDSDPEQWLTSAVFYDKYGRTIQARADNHLGGYDMSTTVYDFNGAALLSRTIHDDSLTQVTINGRNTYDHAGRLLKSFTKIDNDSEIETASYVYNELGQVTAKKVHSEDSSSNYLQTLDYGYNIRGWLKNINDPKQIGDDYFGMRLIRNDDFNNYSNLYKAYNGNISGMEWTENVSGGQQVEEKSQIHKYDSNNRLISTNYTEGNDLSINPGMYKVKNITYDDNGNIKTLDRLGKVDGVRTLIDQLSYTYTNGNKLDKVDDTSNNNMGLKDVSGTDYLYDVNGNVIEDNNKGIDSIVYNYMNKPVEIRFDDGKELRYTYNAAGAKLTLELFANDTSLRKTDYSGAFEYKNGSLQHIHTAGGKLVPAPAGATQDWEHEYYLADHLGNVRVAYRNRAHSFTFTATMESESANTEELEFNNMPPSRAVDPLATSGDEVSRLNSSQMVGPGISLPVYPGDEIDMKAYAYHRGGSGYNNPPDMTMFIAAVAGAFGGSPTGGLGDQNTFSVFDNALNPTIGGLGLQGTVSDTRPAAYLNYLLFDKSFVLKQYGFTQITETANSAELLSIPDVVAEHEGFLYVYVTNESNSLNEVYFDDLQVTVNETNIVQKNSYYPFGMKHDNSWSRIGRENKHQFNAASEMNEETGNYEMFFRAYDPVIGRMSGVDPYAESFVSHTPYNYGVNDPISYNDPSGGISLIQAMYDRNGGGRGEIYGSGGGGGGGGGSYRRGAGSYANGTHWSQQNGLASSSHQAGARGEAVYRKSDGSIVIHMNRVGSSGGTWSDAEGYNNFESDEAAAVFAVHELVRNGGIRHTKLYKDLRNIGRERALLFHGGDGRINDQGGLFALACVGCQGDDSFMGIKGFWNTHAGRDILREKERILDFIDGPDGTQGWGFFNIMLNPFSQIRNENSHMRKDMKEFYHRREERKAKELDLFFNLIMWRIRATWFVSDPVVPDHLLDVTYPPIG